MEEDSVDPQLHQNDNWFHKLSTKTKNVIKNVTVEPAIFVMFLGIGLDASTLDQMQIDKCCRDDFDFNETVCANLTDDQYKNESSMVSDEVNSNRSQPCFNVFFDIKKLASRIHSSN